MLLLVGLYARFIHAVAELSTLRIRRASVLQAGGIAFFAGVAILLSAGPIKDLVVHYRWQVFSVFIGMRLGAVPVVWKLARPATPAVWAGVATGLAITAVLAGVQYATAGSGEPLIPGPVGSFLAGLVGASATMLPGMDGSYFLLLMGQYVPILASIDRFADALKTLDAAAAFAEFRTLVPVGLGVAIGIGGVSLGLRWLFRHHLKPTAGVLLGIVIGAVGGLWPFRKSVAPELGSTVKGTLITPENLASIPKDDWPVVFFSPTPTQVIGALGMIVAGYILARLLARLDPDERKP
jgi:putative membrane protein